MTASVMNWTFKKAVYVSLGAHLVVFLLIVLSPHFPRPSKKGFIQYIPLNMVGPAGGGTGGRGAAGPPRVGTTPVGKRETLKDLTTPQKAKAEPKSEMRYPVDKPKREPKAKAPKKAAITKRESAPPGKQAQAGAPEGVPEGTATAGGFGSGLRIGTGNGTGGWGPGGPGSGGGLGLLPQHHHGKSLGELVHLARRPRGQRKFPDRGLFPDPKGRPDRRPEGRAVERHHAPRPLGHAGRPGRRALSPTSPGLY
jgi:hypothetical protein